MEKFVLFALLTWLTHNPLLALLLVLLLSATGFGYFSGGFVRLPRAFHRWRTIAELRQAVATNPHDAAARSDLGRLLVEAGKPREALDHLEAAIQRMPDQAETLYVLGAARLGVGDHAQGRPAVERALALDPRLRYGEPYLTLADFYLERKEYAQAIPLLEECVGINASSVEGRYKLGQALWASGDAKGAEAILTEAVEIFPQLPGFRRRVARPWKWKAQLLLGKVRAALRGSG